MRHLVTDYQVNTVERLFVLSVGHPSPELARLFQSSKENHAAFITAWNPLGKPTSDSINHIAEQQLIVETEARDLSYLDCESKDPSVLWPNGPS